MRANIPQHTTRTMQAQSIDHLEEVRKCLSDEDRDCIMWIDFGSAHWDIEHEWHIRSRFPGFREIRSLYIDGMLYTVVLGYMTPQETVATKPKKDKDLEPPS